jgi:glycosyltransferase involved in cell wall biosynthesis
LVDADLLEYSDSVATMTAKSTAAEVLYISHVGMLGGAERTLLDLISALNQRLFHPRVVVPAEGELSERCRELGIPVEYCPHLARLSRSGSVWHQTGQVFRLLNGAMRLRAIARATAPAIIHANSTTAALFATCLPSRTRPPVLWHVRDLVALKGIGRMLARSCERIVVPSDACRKSLRDIADESKVITIPNGIEIAAECERPNDAACAMPEPAATEAGRIVVATIGQLVRWKRHDVAIEVARRVVAQCPNVDFLIVADDRLESSEVAIRGLRDKVRAFGLTGRVEVSPYASDIGKVLRGAHVLLHAAFPEPFGRVIVEAMAAGCPVVACQGDHGPGEILRHGIDGLLVDPDSVDAFARAVMLLAGDADLRSRMRREGRKRAVELYDRRLMAERMQAVYASVAARRSV